MRLHDWGEENFIQYLAAHFPTPPPIVGIGDDTAVIPDEHGSAWLITTDALVEGVHFLKGSISAQDLGYKTIAVSVSDIAAMGGKPQYAFLSIALPHSIEHAWVCDFIQGVKEACTQWGLLLLGGDTVGSKKDIFLNLTLLGHAQRETIKYRNSAQLADIICVTSFLGDAAGGLKSMQEKLLKTEDVKFLIHAHSRPTINPAQGIWLAAQEGVHAMMDLSDGLDCDLQRLLKSSQVGCLIETTRIPLSKQLQRVSQENHWDALQCALTGGEDYCLLVTVDQEAFKRLEPLFQKTFGQPLWNIGYITSPAEGMTYLKEEKPIEIRYKHFNHFE